MILKTKSYIFFSLTFFLFFFSKALEADILEKYLKQETKEEVEGVTIAPEDTELIQREAKKKPYSGISPSQRDFTSKALGKDPGRSQRSFRFNLAFGANRNHLQNKISFSTLTTSRNKFSPSLGLELNYDDKDKHFSSIMFFLGLKYVLLHYHGLEFTLGLQQELENAYSHSEGRETYTFLNTRAETRLSYELTSNFILYTSFAPKYSFVTDAYLRGAPPKMAEEIRQILDFNYGFLISL